jgi:uncharacterized caspase-like protein
MMAEPGGTGRNEAQRAALVVAVSQYADPLLRQLRAPAEDAIELGTVLSDSELGAFGVTTVVDRPAQETRIAIDEFLSVQRPGDLSLVYLSCHGLMDARRRLYFAAADTRKERLAATGIEARWLLDQLDECRARRQIVILDCCFSGAFAGGSKGDDDVGIGDRLLGDGRGRVVLTASRATEYSFEGERTSREGPSPSAFTAALVAGIRTGAADRDDDGWITVDDAYAYAFDEMRAAGAAQTPQRWLYGAEGGIVLARNPSATDARTEPPLSSDAVEGRRSVASSGSRGRRRPRWTYVAAVVAVLLAAGVFLVDQLTSGPDKEFSFDGKVVESIGPWRMYVFDNLGPNDVGCTVTVTDLADETSRTIPGGGSPVYHESLWQMRDVGRFRLEPSRPGCEAGADDGTGDAGSSFKVDQGDSEMFNPSGTIQVTVAKPDFVDDQCKIVLRDGENGAQITSVLLTPQNPSMPMDPGERSSVYLSDVPCPVSMSDE